MATVRRVTASRKQAYLVEYKCPYCGEINTIQSEVSVTGTSQENKALFKDSQQEQDKRLVNRAEAAAINALDRKVKSLLKSVNEKHLFRELRGTNAYCANCNSAMPWNPVPSAASDVITVVLCVAMILLSVLFAFFTLSMHFGIIFSMLCLSLIVVVLFLEAKGLKKKYCPIIRMRRDCYPIIVVPDNLNSYIAWTKSGRAGQMPGTGDDYPSETDYRNFVMIHCLKKVFRYFAVALVICGIILLNGAKKSYEVPIEYLDYSSISGVGDYVETDVVALIPYAGTRWSKGKSYHSNINRSYDHYYMYCVDDKDNIFLTYIAASLLPQDILDFASSADTRYLLGGDFTYVPDVPFTVTGLVRGANSSDESRLLDELGIATIVDYTTDSIKSIEYTDEMVFRFGIGYIGTGILCLAAWIILKKKTAL